MKLVVQHICLPIFLAASRCSRDILPCAPCMLPVLGCLRTRLIIWDKAVRVASIICLLRGACMQRTLESIRPALLLRRLDRRRHRSRTKRARLCRSAAVSPAQAHTVMHFRHGVPRRSPYQDARCCNIIFTRFPEGIGVLSGIIFLSPLPTPSDVPTPSQDPRKAF